MTINEPTETVTDSIKVETTSGGVVAPKVEPSAPEKSEQNESTESDTEENEASKVEGESEGDETPTDAERDKPRKQGGFQKRIGKLNAKISAAQSEVEYWKEQALKGANQSKTETKTETVKSDDASKPDPDKFDTHVAYVEALTDWKLEQREKARDFEAQKTKLQAEQKTIESSHFERVKAFAAKTDDYDEMMENLDDVRAPHLAEVIMTSENGPAILYELAKNKEEALRISKLSPLAAARELGKIESKLAAPEKDQETQKTTKAPKPITPVGGKGGVVEKSIYDTNLPQAEYERLRAKKRSA